jgi:FtsH-binding integral membrane protein
MNEFRNQNFNQQQQPWSPAEGWGSLQATTAAQASVAERMSFVRKVYALFFAASLFAIGGVAFGIMTPAVLNFAAGHPWIMLFMMLGGVFAAQAVRHVRGLNLVALFGFTTLTGVMISPLIAFVLGTNPTSILAAGVLTVGIFGGLTAYAFISKRDFSFMRGMLTVGLVVVVLASLLNIFLAMSAFSFAISAAALVLFSGFVLYDTSNIIRRYPTNEYVAGALSLYLDAFNIFLALINILNSGRR